MFLKGESGGQEARPSDGLKTDRHAKQPRAWNGQKKIQRPHTKSSFSF